MADINDRILEYVSTHPGLSGKQIAKAFGLGSTEVDRILYYELGPDGGGPLEQDEKKKWHLRKGAAKPAPGKASRLVPSVEEKDISIFKYTVSGSRTDMNEHKELYFPAPYKDDEREKLKRLLTVLGKEDLTDIVASYCPRDVNAFLLFLRNKSKHIKDKRFSVIGSALLTCAMYMSTEGSTSTESLLEETKTHLRQTTRNVEGISSTLIDKVAWNIISHANELGFKVNTPLIPLPLKESKLKWNSNGFNKVPWELVTFNSGSITIDGPLSSAGKRKCPPFTFKDNASDRAMNNIKAYFYRVPPIEIHVTKGKIDRVISTPDLEDHIRPLLRRTGKNVARVDLETLEMMASTGQQSRVYGRTDDVLCELRNRSPYFDWLSTVQIDGYKPILFEERIRHSNDEKTVKGFAFTVKDLGNRVWVVFENEDCGCSSLVFTISKMKYCQEVDSVRDFLRSAEVNKRERLSRNTFLPLINGDVIPYRRVAHTDIETWKKEILP